MNDYILFASLIVIVCAIAKVINKFLPPDYHQRVEEKYNENNE